MIISNSSPLIVLGRIGRIDIFASLFGQVYIPGSVYHETVVETKIPEQRDAILKAIQADVITVAEPSGDQTFRRKLDLGEVGVSSQYVAVG